MVPAGRFRVLLPLPPSIIPDTVLLPMFSVSLEDPSLTSPTVDPSTTTSPTVSFTNTVSALSWAITFVTVPKDVESITSKIDDGTHTASVIDAAAGNTSFESLDVDDFLACVGKLPLYARNGAAFYVSPAGYAASIARLKYALGGNSVSDLNSNDGPSFLGYPVRLVHVMDSTLGADAGVVKVLFGNLGLSSIYASRREFSMRVFDQVYATTEQLLMQGSMRFTISHHSLGDNSEVGPVVALKTAAS